MPEKSLTTGQAERIESITSVKENSEILEMYLSGNSVAEIAEKLQTQPQHISARLTDIEAEFNLQMYELSEKLILRNLGRAEMIMKSVLPLALKADLRAVKAFTDLAKLEIEWHREIKPISHDEAREADDDTIIVEAFEQTLSSSSSLYDVALGHINSEWVSHDAPDVDSIYSNDPLRDTDGKAMEFKGTEPLDSRIGKIEEVVESLIRWEDEDGGS